MKRLLAFLLIWCDLNLAAWAPPAETDFGQCPVDYGVTEFDCDWYECSQEKTEPRICRL